MESDAIFKKCPSCLIEWKTRADFLGDAALELNGYQTNFNKLEQGLFYFTHNDGDCLSTIALEARNFLDLYKGPRYLGSKALGDDCPQYCLDDGQLNRCQEVCECAFVREVTHLIAEAQKGRGASPSPAT